MLKKIFVLLAMISIVIIVFSFYLTNREEYSVTKDQDAERVEAMSDVKPEDENSNLEASNTESLDGQEKLSEIKPEPEDIAPDITESDDVEDIPFGMDVFRDLIYLTDEEGQPIPNDELREAHINFLKEESNFEWAFNMKNNLSDRLTEIDDNRLFNLQYVDCKSKSCELHGVFDGDREDYKKLYGDLKSADWWEFENTFSRSTDDEGGQLKIVTIITRGGD